MTQNASPPLPPSAPVSGSRAASADVPGALGWGELNPFLPGPSSGAGFATLPSRGEGVLYGGNNSTGLHNRTEVYNESVNTWTLQTSGLNPGPLTDFGFAGAPFQNSAVLFGGLTDTTTGAVSNATWVFSFATDTWTHPSTPVAPAPRQNPAFAVANATALLYGGWDQNFSGSGEVLYSDTWELNLATDHWSRIVSAVGPGPLAGASLVWESNLSSFVLFGGCFPCSSATWRFDAPTQTWVRLATHGVGPTARMDAVFAWDENLNVDLLFGGTAGAISLGDTFLFDPVSKTWVQQTASGGPAARSDAAAGFLDLPGNASLLVTGGLAGGGLPVGEWRLSQVSNLTVVVEDNSSHAPIANAYVSVDRRPVLETGPSGRLSTNVPSNETEVNATAPGYAPLRLSVWVAPGSVPTVWLNLTPAPPATVTVLVTDPASNPLPNASVSLLIQGGPVAGSPRSTDALGQAVFPNVPAFNGTVNATRPGYHSNEVPADFVSGSMVQVTIALTPLLLLNLHTVGHAPDGHFSTLSFVPVVLAGGILGESNPHGWLNVTTNLSGTAELVASAFGYVPLFLNLTLNYTGTLFVNLTLQGLPYPVVTVQVLEAGAAGSGLPIANADVNVTSIIAPPSGPFDAHLKTSPIGLVQVFPPAGNYTVVAWAPGFEPGAYPGPLYAPPSSHPSITVFLTPLALATFDVQVVTTATGNAAIDGASVTVGYVAVNLTNGGTRPANVSLVTASDGWVNFTDLPGSTLIVTGSAFGYYTNISTTAVQYGEHVARYLVHLQPIPRTPVGAKPPGEGLSILPAGQPSLWILLLLPILALVGGLVYLTMLRTPPGREPSGVSEEAAPESSPKGPPKG